MVNFKLLVICKFFSFTVFVNKLFLFLVLLLFSLFSLFFLSFLLSLSRLPNTFLRMTTQDMFG